MASMNVGQENSESVHLSYEDHGSGPPVVFIIQGDDDRILPFPITGKRLPEALKESRLVVIEGGSYGIPWTHAEEINRALLDFLK